MVKRVILLFLIIFLLCSSSFSCFAISVPVTKESLTSALQNFTSSDTNEKNYQFEVSDDAINITVEGEKYSIKYDLSEKPTFSFKTSVKNGMTFKEFEEQISNLILPIIGYGAVVNIQGVSAEDFASYFLPLYLKYALGTFSSKNDYLIVDDTVDGFEKPDTTDPKIIYVSEFSEKVMTFVNATYQDTDEVILDDSSTYDTFKLFIRKENEQETSCDIVSTVEVNLDADFSQLEGLSKQPGSFDSPYNITKENADLVIDLKVGQKCKIQTNGTFNGYELFGSCYDYQEVNEKCVEITGTKVGTASGFITLYPGIMKSVYITVEENPNDVPLDTISLTITVPTELTESKDDDKKEDEQSPKVQAQQTPSAGTSKQVVSVLPKAGIKNIVYIIILLSISSIIIFGILTKKYKDIK